MWDDGLRMSIGAFQGFRSHAHVHADIFDSSPAKVQPYNCDFAAKGCTTNLAVQIIAQQDAVLAAYRVWIGTAKIYCFYKPFTSIGMAAGQYVKPAISTDLSRAEYLQR